MALKKSHCTAVCTSAVKKSLAIHRVTVT